ncbi:MAG: hypothetical protein ACOYKZ_05610 [Chlamydiia bacterium]
MGKTLVRTLVLVLASALQEMRLRQNRCMGSFGCLLPGVRPLWLVGLVLHAGRLFAWDWTVTSDAACWTADGWTRGLLQVHLAEGETIDEPLEAEGGSVLIPGPMPRRLVGVGPTTLHIPMAVRMRTQASGESATLAVRSASRTLRWTLPIPVRKSVSSHAIVDKTIYPEGSRIPLRWTLRNEGNVPVELDLRSIGDGEIDDFPLKHVLALHEELTLDLIWRPQGSGKKAITLIAGGADLQAISIAEVVLVPVYGNFDPWDRQRVDVGLAGLAIERSRHVYIEARSGQDLKEASWSGYGRLPLAGTPGTSTLRDLSFLGEPFEAFYLSFARPRWRGYFGDGAYSFNDLILNQQYGRGVWLRYGEENSIEGLAVRDVPGARQGAFGLWGTRVRGCRPTGYEGELAVVQFLPTNRPDAIFDLGTRPCTLLAAGVAYQPGPERSMSLQIGRAMSEVSKAEEAWMPWGPWSWDLSGQYRTESMYVSGNCRGAERGFLGTYSNSISGAGIVSMGLGPEVRLSALGSATYAGFESDSLSEDPIGCTLFSITASSSLPAQSMGTLSLNYQRQRQGWHLGSRAFQLLYASGSWGKSWSHTSLSLQCSAGMQQSMVPSWEGAYFSSGTYASYGWENGVQCTCFIQGNIARGQVIPNLTYGLSLRACTKSLDANVQWQDVIGCGGGVLLQGTCTWRLPSDFQLHATVRSQKIFQSEPTIGALLTLSRPLHVPYRHKRVSSVRGRVTDSRRGKGEPLQGVIVSAQGLSCMTDQRGEYHLGPLNGDGTDLTLSQLPSDTTTMPGFPLAVELALQRITTQDVEVLGAARVQLACLSPEGDYVPGIRGVLRQGELEVFFQTSKGPLTIKSLRPGRWELLLYPSDDWEAIPSRSFLLTAGGQLDLELTCSPRERRIRWLREAETPVVGSIGDDK